MLFTDIRHKSNNPRKLLETVSPTSQALFRLILLIQVITDELIEPAEDLVVPLETTQKVKSEQTENKKPNVPISMIQNPVVLIWKNNQSTRYTKPIRSKPPPQKKNEMNESPESDPKTNPTRR